MENIGFNGLANKYGNGAKLNLRPFAYPYGGAKAPTRGRNRAFTLTIDGNASAFPGWFVAVGNVEQYGSGLRFTPDARVNDGLPDAISLGRAAGFE